MQKRNDRRGARTQKAGKQMALGTREKRRLIQLGICAGLFLVVFLGKGAAPAGVAGVGETLLQLIQSDTDFQSAFSAVGEAVSQGEPVLETMKKLAVEVFGAGAQEPGAAPVNSVAVQSAVKTLAERPTGETMLLQLGKTSVEEETGEPGGEAEAPDGEAQTEQDGEQETGQETEQDTQTETEPPQIPEYTGPEPPEGATMEYFDLGLAETVAPVMGPLTSAFGYRDHPVSGEYLFHNGIDLAADSGTPILAFADGTVEFIGESDAYGLYIQLDHGNGVKTFYCHCSALYAQTGDSVAMGQTIAAVGDTGNATGPHLHMEIKKDGVRLNPLYYVETAEG